MIIGKEHPLRVIKTPDIAEPEISKQKKELLKQFADFIFKEISKKHSLSYVRDIATNFGIRRGINLIFKENSDGSRIYQYTLAGKTIFLKGEKELDFLGETLMDLVLEEQKKQEKESGKRIIL